MSTAPAPRCRSRPTPRSLRASSTEYYDTLSQRLREIAYLNPGLRIVVTDERNDKRLDLLSSGGITQFVSDLNTGKDCVHDRRSRSPARPGA